MADYATIYANVRTLLRLDADELPDSVLEVQHRLVGDRLANQMLPIMRNTAVHPVQTIASGEGLDLSLSDLGVFRLQVVSVIFGERQVELTQLPFEDLSQTDTYYFMTGDTLSIRNMSSETTSVRLRGFRTYQMDDSDDPILVRHPDLLTYALTFECAKWTMQEPQMIELAASKYRLALNDARRDTSRRNLTLP